MAVTEPGHLAVLAIPGSGKTRVIETKTCYILDRDPNARVLVVTFTNKAASEVSRRIQIRYGKKDRRFAVGTFHSLALKQLRRAKYFPKIMPPTDYDSTVTRAWLTGAPPPELTREQAAHAIDHYKSTLQPPVENTPQSRVFKVYTDILKRNGLSDFSDLLIDAVEGMRDGIVQPFNITHLLVDEYQDTDSVQDAWISEHTQRGAITTVVGDDDQSIYGWRYAMGYVGMTQFKRRFSAKEVILDTNYRSHSEILDRALCLIQKNQQRFNKPLISGRGGGGSVTYRIFQNSKLEAEEIAKTVYRSPNDWAVLGRCRSVLERVESDLKVMGIPFTRYGGKPFFDLKAPALFIGLLRDLDKQTNVTVERILHLIGIAEDEISHLRDISECNLLSGLLCVKDKWQVTGRSAEVLHQFANAARYWKATLAVSENDPLRVDGVVHAVADWLTSHFDTKELDHEHISIVEDAFTGRGGTLSQRITAATRPVDTSRGDGVQLMTFHASKGLEFPNVWLASVNESIVPHERALSEFAAGIGGGIEEERRLFYVAMTRAKEQLVISSTPSKRHGPSRFLDDAGLRPAEESVARSA